MSFYGSISNAGKTQIQFDKVYPNRKIMEENAKSDGIFIGRYVLIEYDDNTYSRRIGYIDESGEKPEKDTETILYLDSSCLLPFQVTVDNDTGYGLAAGDIVIVTYKGTIYYYTYTGRTLTDGVTALFQLICSSKDVVGNIENPNEISDYLLNYQIDKNFYSSEDKQDEYYFTTGWDSTIWKKVYRYGKEQYELIASLNSELPSFTIAPEAPTVNPIAPHFGENSTNINYQLHIQPNWGLKVKEVKEDEPSDSKVSYTITEYDLEKKTDVKKTVSYKGAIYYNKAGFKKEQVSHSNLENNITISPTGTSGNKYVNHKTGKEEERPDIQEIIINLPEIGNIMSYLWDLVYGGKEITGTNNRNLDISWNSSSGVRMLAPNPEGGGFLYSTNGLETIAGCINSVHDLMGMIISEAPAPNQTIEEALEKALSNRIYYGKLSDSNPRESFYFKDKTYKYISFEDKKKEDPDFDEETFVGSRKYYDLTQFLPNTLYTYENKNFYLASENVPLENVDYYKLGDPIKVKLKVWQPEIEKEEGSEDTEIEIQYSYYKDNENNYIKDTNSQPTPGRVYYTIKARRATSTNTEIFNPVPHKVLEEIPDLIDSGYESEYLNNKVIRENNIKMVCSGLFYLKKDEEGVPIGLVAVQDPETDIYIPGAEYYFIPQYAKGVNQDETATENVSLYFLDGDKSLLPFLEVFESGNDEKYKDYKINILEYKENTYYSEMNPEEEPYLEGYKHLAKQSDFDREIIYYTLQVTEDALGGGNENPNPEDEVYYYQPGLFFRHYLKTDYILATETAFFKDEDYYLLKDKNGNILESDKKTGLLVIEPEPNNYYRPGQFYYRLSGLDGDILDKDTLMKDESYTSDKFGSIEVEPTSGLIYFIPQYAYVVRDEAGILDVGYRWDKDVSPPNTVTLGVREEEYKWFELQGFSKTYNTINGLILELNKYFKFDDTYTRDKTTIQGCLNTLNDIINGLDILNPGDIVVIDNYGRLSGTSITNLRMTDYKLGTSTGNVSNTDTLLEAISKLENRIKELESKI